MMQRIKSERSAKFSSLIFLQNEVLIKLARVYKVSTDFLLGNENQKSRDVSGLSENEITAIKNLIKAMQE